MHPYKAVRDAGSQLRGLAVGVLQVLVGDETVLLQGLQAQVVGLQLLNQLPQQVAQ